MKLKKLLPLAGMTGVAAIAAPLVTSCAQKGTEIVWNKGEDLPKPEVQTTHFDTYKEATEAYFDAIDKDKTLLSRDIVCSNGGGHWDYITDVTKTSVRTDNVNKDEKKVSYVSKVEGKIDLEPIATPIKGTFEYEAKNVEFCITYDPDGTAPDTKYYFQPTLTKEIEVAQYAVEHGTGVEVAAAVNTVMNHAEKLAKDNSWYFYASEETDISKATQRVDASNVYEYAYEVMYDYSITLWGFAHLTTYFGNIDVPNPV